MSSNCHTADTQGYFSRMLRGEVVRPPVLTLLSSRIEAVDAAAGSLAAGQGVATLNLNVSFLRAAHVGTLQGEARMLRRGRDVCHVMGTLLQNGKDVATAVAVCKVVPVT